ncbi:sensor histidine kinase [Salegentibacter salarius]|uniref:sensor histidine kinase n=1 Tax=Salegentibacter salarius TaxID=435906 RepID=UPI0012FEB7AF|nr:HAMP domain-containing sensor histidine kinase [Salegentibacter salarius]
MAITFVSFNTIAIWKPYDAFFQFGVLGVMVFFLNYIDFIDLKNLLLLGGYTTFSLCLVSIAFPSIKTLSLKDEIEEEYKQTQKVSDFGLENQVLRREIENNESKLAFLENKAKIFQHDLKNHLGSIESMIELIELEDRYLKKSEGPDYLPIIKNALDEADEKNKDFFRNFSEEAAVEERIKKVPLELHDIIHKNIYKFIEHTSSRNINFDLALKANASVILGDSKILNTAMYNILKYALDFSKNNDWIKILTRNESDSIIMEVVNANSGMSMTTMESYFKNINIYNLENIQNNQGLGLSIAKRNIEQLDGHLSYSASNSLGFEFLVEFKIEN